MIFMASGGSRNFSGVPARDGGLCFYFPREDLLTFGETSRGEAVGGHSLTGWRPRSGHARVTERPELDAPGAYPRGRRKMRVIRLHRVRSL